MPRYYSHEEKQSIIEEFQQSGLSKAKFSKLKNIGESSLYKWSKEIEEPPLSIEENNFISMQVDVTDASIANNKNFFLNLPNNVILEFPCGFDVHYLNKLITKLLK